MMRLFKLVFLVLAGISVTDLCYAATYYVSNTGSDSAAGTSTATAWKTIAKVNSASLNNGDQILLQRGGIWREMLSPTVSGLSFDAYGTGARPIISGADLLTGTWTKVNANTCSMNVGGSDLTEVWMKGVLGAPVASAAVVYAPGEWFYSNGILTLGVSGGCAAANTTALAIEITRRSYALYANNIGALSVANIAFVNGMYNTIYLGPNLTSTQTFNNVVWQGARYEGLLAAGGSPVINSSEGLNSLSGMAAAGGNGFTLTNSILSGNSEDAIEIYGTTGASTINSSTISGNSTEQPLYNTISNWSSYPLNATNSILLPNPYDPQTYSFTGLTDDGTNVETSPLFTQRAAPLIIIPFIDDYINLGVAQDVAAAAKQYGCTFSYALNTKLVTPADWTTIAAMQKAGTDIVAHTRSHSDLANNNVFAITYVGSAATSATMTINQTAGTLQTFLNGSKTADLTVQILDKYNSVQIMCNSINANPAYSCVVQPNQLYFTPLNLANVKNVNIKSSYMTQAASGYLTWEVEGAQSDIAANIPGYTATTFATPFTSSNLTVENHIRSAGFVANRNGTVDANLQPNGNWALSNLDVYNLAADWLPDQYDLAHPAGSVGALVEALGASGGIFAVYSHGYDEFTLAQWTQLFQLLQQDGATCMTFTQARAYIGAHGTLVPDGTKKNWVEQVPLSPVFSNTSSSPAQGAHGLQ
jgi:hypothetical protein